MLHEHEPGAWDFARRWSAPRRAARRDPAARRRRSGRVHAARGVPRAPRPAILHTHLVHADAYGQIAGALTRVPVRFSTKHGFNEFREGPSFASRRPDRRQPRPRAHRDLAGLARYLADRGLRRGELRDRPLRDRPRRRAAARSRRRAAAPLRRPPDPDQGPHRPAARLRRGEEGDARPELDIAGRGPLEPALRALAHELGIADSVRFLGYVARSRSAIERSAVVVVPSMGEGFGMVALEAMERARPVIAAEIGGLGELVRDGETGLLVPPGEAEPLARRDRRAGRRPGARGEMGRAGRQRALARVPESAASTGPRSSTGRRSAAKPDPARRALPGGR